MSLVFIQHCQFTVSRSRDTILYNNQINAHALTGQSAMAYCAGKPREKIARLLNYYIKQ